MLILTRKPGEKIVIGNGITVTVVDVTGNKVRLGIDAPDQARILRAELTCRQEDPLDADLVEWVTQTAGDGLGFDVLSFDDGDGSEKLVEVKTTGLGKYFPCSVTATEVRCSE